MSYLGATQRSSSNRVIDLRSDTVTRPSPAMRAAMAAAEVGDDVYGEDPTVNALEVKVAALLGKEAALFVPSGSQSNLIALLTHCQRGEEYLVGASYHSFAAEAGGAAVLGGIAPFPLAVDAKGAITPAQVKAAIKPDDPHYPITRLLCLENTVSGQVQPLEAQQALAKLAHAEGLVVHLDGARLMNAAVALGVPPRALTAPMDSVSLCLSKGLGAPVGSVLSGTKSFIARARRHRKLVGGAMRQVGILAAAGLYALEHNVERLAEDHRNAAALAAGLTGLPGLTTQPAASNMVFIEPAEGRHEPLVAHLAERGIIVGAQKPRMRLVTHLDVTADDIDRVVEAFKNFFLKAVGRAF